MLGGGVLLVLGGVAARIATNVALQERIASMFTLRGHSSNSFRVNVWTGVFHMIHDNWIVGIGIGNTAFRKMYSLYMYSGFEALGAYNIFLEVLSEMGVIGLAIFAWMLLAFIARNLETARRAHKAGVRFAMGSDAVRSMFGENTRELAWFIKAGLTPEEALKSATVNGAELLQIQDSLGKLRPGYLADIVAVEGNPLADIQVVIDKVRWVMKNGAVVVDRH